MLNPGDIAWDICSVLSYFLIGWIVFPLRKNIWKKLVVTLIVASVVFCLIDLMMYLASKKQSYLFASTTFWLLAAMVEIMVVTGIATLFQENVWRVMVVLMFLQVFSTILIGFLAQLWPVLAQAIQENALQRKKVGAASYFFACVSQLLVPIVVSVPVRLFRKKYTDKSIPQYEEVCRRFVQVYVLWAFVQSALRAGLISEIGKSGAKAGTWLFVVVYGFLLLIAFNVLLFYYNRIYGTKVKTEYAYLRELADSGEQHYKKVVQEHAALEEVRRAMQQYTDRVSEQAKEQKLLKGFAEDLRMEQAELAGDIPLTGDLVTDAAMAGLYGTLSERGIIFELTFQMRDMDALKEYAEYLVMLAGIFKGLVCEKAGKAYLVLALRENEGGLFVSAEGDGVSLPGGDRRLRKLKRLVQRNGGTMQGSLSGGELSVLLFLPEYANAGFRLRHAEA